MFSNATIALILAIGVAGWVYSKVNLSTGGNTQSTLIVTAVAAVFTFVLALILIGFIPGA